MSVTRKVDGEGIFSHAGIALTTKNSDDSPLVVVHDHGAIYDPIDGRPQGEHYSTTHFALLSAILFTESQDPSYLESAKSVIKFADWNRKVEEPELFKFLILQECESVSKRELVIAKDNFSLNGEWTIVVLHSQRFSVLAELRR